MNITLVYSFAILFASVLTIICAVLLLMNSTLRKAELKRREEKPKEYIN